MRPPGVRSGSELLALRKRRMATAPAVLQGGFRPFFLAAGAWAIAAIALWLCTIEGVISAPRGLDPLAWHRHEMLFGFAGAAVAGFVLTAIPNWTGRFPVAGAPLAALVGLWTAARFLLLLLPPDLVIVAALFDAGLYVALAAYAFREVRLAKNRNLPIALLLFLFGATDALDYACALGIVGDTMLGVRAGLAILAVMISVIGGRIIPSFTRNWLGKRAHAGRLPGQPDRFDMGTIVLTAASMLLWILVPAAAGTGVLLIAAALFQAVRLARWQGLKTVAEPLLFVLHIGYLWLVVALLFLGLGILSPLVPQSAAIHSLGVGAVGTMILAVTTRVSLGHTGRELRAHRAMVLGYVLICGAAIARIATAMGWIDYRFGLRLSAALWILTFVLFLVLYVPVLTGPRLGEK
jgi:uncharacterized protein involved in response to NO